MKLRTLGMLLLSLAIPAGAGVLTTLSSGCIDCNVDPGGGGEDADADFAARCAAAGVVVCYPMDDSSELVAIPLQTASDGTTQGAIDSTDFVSGGGSLKFNLRAGVSVPNIGGAWSVPLGANFGENTTFYVQFRWKVDAQTYTNITGPWDNPSFKLSNIHGPTLTCQDTEITTFLSPRWVGITTRAYHDCGIGFQTSTSSTQAINNCDPTCMEQQGSSFTPGPGVGYNCQYNVSGESTTGGGDGCFLPEADTWYVMYQEFNLGTRGNPNTDYNAWVATAGGPYLQFLRITGLTWGDTDDAFFSELRLETYMTEIGGAASITSHIWYDELIISTQPIAQPEF